ncbi:pantetheine-phosphate adenylyltransferase [Secundilactobacillus paracollinoides]|uniref:Phosphopantetheine adenylyltransferase n=1 Tax=Secundilactobacillus paracollinoides TaxID=240427 RepID=A0A1B2J0F5_9LACO|nr:pantetheine-phosphate adenylyltransferase [Secundilactobacillus paracollinoides]ANZ61809.1 pantetheine-phosphate adenylyltransferase [Secundilactobacillus paracollinoides]ANZ63446.1 pantetheine-phosphate adenylyltransferase [Secundilactobacillus paracollinoides]ANZ67728.1 pantetheine-phosphate adenylyltransferase [Secundilactobacillus paracollinoides]KRL75792.1 phosphopantetheine adenylyltransferase [Secundilactobacillus paracollinoides DSM 15502 = JCM 11969]
MTKAVFPGSFDPLTMGHLNLIQRASGLFDELIVTVGTNISKRSLFTPDERVALIQESVADLSNVRVQMESGLTVDFVKSVNASVILRGLRNSKDYDYEAGIAQMNHYLDNGIETLFLLTDAKYAFISSSLLKEVLHFGGDISELVPPAVVAALAKK